MKSVYLQGQNKMAPRKVGEGYVTKIYNRLQFKNTKQTKYSKYVQKKYKIIVHNDEEIVRSVRK